MKLINERKDDLGNFLTSDERGKQVLGFLETAIDVLGGDQKTMTDEMASLMKNIDHIKQIVSVQQSHARGGEIMQKVSMVGLIEDALRVNMLGVEGGPIRVMREFRADPEMMTDKHAVLQILINLATNAKHALMGNGRTDKRLTVRIEQQFQADREFLCVKVIDNGVGIEPANLTRVFNHGFTTKKEGHGFGLHSSANTAKQLGGSLTAESEGPGKGACFTLLMPVLREAVIHEQAA
jgi:C4-dicarboxylate-specific signal transduction histidine kinase